jgi:hypothetical protein
MIMINYKIFIHALVFVFLQAHACTARCSLALEYILFIFIFIVNLYVCTVQQFNCTRYEGKGKDATVSVR